MITYDQTKAALEAPGVIAGMVARMDSSIGRIGDMKASFQLEIDKIDLEVADKGEETFQELTEAKSTAQSAITKLEAIESIINE